MTLPLILALGATGAFLAGCQAPAPPTGPTQARVTLASPEAYEAFWQTADKSLRRYYLPPERTDRLEGVITSYPETSTAWFEFWRPQPKPAYTWWEANLQTIRRQATITIKPVEAPEYDVSVEVDRYRFSLPERQVDNPAAALRLYGGFTPTIETGRREKQAESGQWILLGRDGQMEQAILAYILKRYGSGESISPTSEPSPTGPAGIAG